MIHTHELNRNGKDSDTGYMKYNQTESIVIFTGYMKYNQKESIVIFSLTTTNKRSRKYHVILPDKV